MFDIHFTVGKGRREAKSTRRIPILFAVLSSLRESENLSWNVFLLRNSLISLPRNGVSKKKPLISEWQIAVVFAISTPSCDRVFACSLAPAPTALPARVTVCRGRG